ncbi:deazaflavin-dependent oxidoreductase (nitroreductase family) [Nocardioides sp. J9]|uniref:nitroreductase family deazaflavin-dependent oxidoreductase n=1 Tax=unclassified Nocardioides TaxID=2615069 RepID=UPI00048C5A0F|nr:MULTISPECIES: nitroreductase family deazaflavin-dependent oxidoreductase [unclassified Nocardioides]TWG94071.1 deazaflavin-dependent oxidoreductase (nitroreductase family) [Nocardioides sp. J9]
MPALPKERPDGLDKPVVAKIIKYGARANVFLYRLTNGRVGAKWRIGAGWRKPVPVLLLDHVGRRSGRTFTTPLLYLDDAPNLVVVASQGGLPRHPQWFHNLVANPDTAVAVPGERHRPVRARVAGPEERAALWPRLVDLYADFDSYQAWTDREIPVVVLEPR